MTQCTFTMTIVKVQTHMTHRGAAPPDPQGWAPGPWALGGLGALGPWGPGGPWPWGPGGPWPWEGPWALTAARAARAAARAVR